MSNRTKKAILAVVIMVPIALLHFVTGDSYQGPYPEFVNGYLIDILLPMGFYLLFCLNMGVLFSSWIIKAGMVFGMACLVEMAQRMGIPLFGRVFDPWDVFMYAMGVALAVLLDMVIFPRLFAFWNADRLVDAKHGQALEGPFSWRFKSD